MRGRPRVPVWYGSIKGKLDFLVVDSPPFYIIIGCPALESFEEFPYLGQEYVCFRKGEKLLSYVLATITVTRFVIQIANGSLQIQTEY